MILVAIVAVLAGVVATIGWTSKEARKPLHKRGVMVNGAATLAKSGRAVWRRPGLVLDRVAASYLAGLAVTVGVVLAVAPHHWPKVVVPAVTGLCVGGVVWDWRLTGGRPWGVVLAEIFTKDAAERAVTAVHPDAKTGAVTVRQGRVEVAVEHVGPLDPERVGDVLHAAHAEVVPSAERGRSTIRLHDQPPPPEVDPWVALSVSHRWPGPSSHVYDADIPVGVDVHGNVVRLPFPGSGGKHLLVGGSTGSGKSVFLSVILAELAYRENIRFMFGDPKYVELALWEPRAAVIAGGAAETGKLLDAVHAEMMDRYQWLQKERRREWAVGRDGDQIMLVIDELSAVTTGAGSGPRLEMLNLILAMGRAAGVGLIGCTQKPSYKIVPTDLRSNFRSRVGLGCDEDEQTDAIMNSRTKWPCHDIPPSLPGTAYVRIDRQATLCRSFLLTDDDIDRVAAATAHLKGA